MRSATIALYGSWVILVLVTTLLISFENAARLKGDFTSTASLDFYNSLLALISIAPMSIAVRLTALLLPKRARLTS